MKSRVRRFAVLAVACIASQASLLPQEQLDRSKDYRVQGLLLPAQAHVKVVVTADDGVPLPGVLVAHANLKNDLLTDQSGQVEFNTSAPYFVLRKSGYESVRLATKDALDYRAVLRKLPGGEQFPLCSEAEISARAAGWNGIFQLPKAKTAKAGREVTDVDYVARGVAAKSRSKLLWAEQGRGPMWGSGDPRDEQAWTAVRYREFTYKLGDHLQVVDAKMWMPGGKCERQMGIWGETTLYYGLDCDSVQPLDDLINQACATPEFSKHLLW